MRAKVELQSEAAEKTVRDIRRATRRQYSEEKVRIVIAGLHGEKSIAELCHKQGINQNLYYRCRMIFWKRARSKFVPQGTPMRASLSITVAYLYAAVRECELKFKVCVIAGP